ncbi:helix-turn-helix domain-containing protein [Argonema antarcticum]|uniref:helix-turn-helix domain-containing protein n=1 Tax=Argonema antarcticum TaxID=2942763 RepID=UPI0020114BCB|nr:transcriptional regulator [Argonema antarcticum]MCL1473811.1 transcriptional regulator [Argonema antarcticum A004/B2]
MTRTFNAKSYTELLVRYQPKPIVTEAENDRAIALVQELEHRSPRTVEEEVFLELLLVLIEKFEEENYPISTVNSISMVQHLMDARDLEESDLIPILGSETTVSEILMNKRPIKHDEARKLAEFFCVEMDLFLESDSTD